MASFMSFHGEATAYSSWKHPTSYAISKSGLHLSRKISPSLAVSKSQPVLSLKKQPPGKIPLKLSGKQLRFLGWEELVRHRGSAQILVIKSTSSESSSSLYDVGSKNELDDNLSLAVGILFCTWHVSTLVLYGLTRDVYVYFRFPFFVSAAQLLVSVTWCFIHWLFRFHKPAPLNMHLFRVLVPIAALHAIGIAMSNFCMVFVGGSLPNIIKGLEPLFSALASQTVLGYQIPISLWLSVATVIMGVSLTLPNYCFNWLGFISAMLFTTSFTYRNIYLKKAMKSLDSTSLYAYTSLISLYFCVPLAILIEGPELMQYGESAIAMYDMCQLLPDLLVMGGFYHITSMIAIKTLEWVDPLTLAVGNISERLFVICFSIVVYEMKVSRQMGIGTVMGICGIIIYSIVKSNLEKHRKVTNIYRDDSKFQISHSKFSANSKFMPRANLV